MTKTYTTICLRASRGLRMNLRVRRVTGVSAILTDERQQESIYVDRFKNQISRWEKGGREGGGLSKFAVELPDRDRIEYSWLCRLAVGSARAD